MENELIKIIEKYDINGFDQGRRWGTDKNTTHSYCDFYESFLTPYKSKQISILEIGSNYGGSSIMWYEFFPMSKLVLVDICENINSKIYDIFDKDRYEYVICDAYDEDNSKKIENLFGNEGFDLIFDDGPHTLESQLKCLEYYLPMLKDDGCLIIEDVQDKTHFELFENYMNSLDANSEIKYKFASVDLTHIKNRYDDLIFWVERINNDKN